MVFSSIIFLFAFLPLVLFLVHLVPKRFQNSVLLLGSLLFYAWGENIYIGVMIVSVCMNFLFGRILANTSRRNTAKIVLFFGIVFNLGLLCGYKYIHFFIDIFNLLIQKLDLSPIIIGEVHLPIGISFFTFQALSYLIDVYRNPSIVQKNLLKLSLYISFFPQLIAGPIVRYLDIAHEIDSRNVQLSDFAEGIERFIIGLGKKVMIANIMAVPADQIFAIPLSDLTPPLAWIGILCYTLQIYFDFSGYSDMAIGLGRMFGFHFNENFNAPYLSRSIQEFWRRWHISLSTWFRDYLYIPLGGNRKGAIRTYIHLLIVFFLCGLWHGAAWTFVVWGLFHGCFLVIERWGLSPKLKKLPAWINHIYVLGVVIVGWVFFRCSTIPDSWYYLKTMIGINCGNNVVYYATRFLDGKIVAAFLGGCMCLLFESSALTYWKSIRSSIFVIWERVPMNGALLNGLRWIGIVSVMMISVMELAAGSYNPFIYFRF